MDEQLSHDTMLQTAGGKHPAAEWKIGSRQGGEAG